MQQSVEKQYNKFSWPQIIVFVFMFLFIAFNLLQIGGYNIVYNVNNNISGILSLVVTVFLLVLYLQVAAKSHDKNLWMGMTLGWILWTIAEIWWAVASLAGNEIPYPSAADFFWILGYFPMYFSLQERYRTVPKTMTFTQKVIIWMVSIVILAVTIIFILVPIVQYFDPSYILESVFNLLYPLADLILLIMVLRIMFNYQMGLYGRAWIWISVGYILETIADLFFAYASNLDIYYPNEQINLVSLLGVDIPYNLSYMLMIVGLMFLWWIRKSHQVIPDVEIVPKLVPNNHILVFTNAENNVSMVSKNCSHILLVPNPIDKPLPYVLGINPSDAFRMMDQIRANKILKEEEISINTIFGEREAWISGRLMSGPEGGNFWGISLLIRFFLDDQSFDSVMTDYEKGVLGSMLTVTGVNEEEDIKNLLSEYYLAHFRALYNQVLDEGGSIMAEAFTAQLKNIAHQKGWTINFNSSTFMDINALSMQQTQDAYPVLLESAKQVVSEITDQETVLTLLQKVKSNFSEPVMRNIANYDKALFTT